MASTLITLSSQKGSVESFSQMVHLKGNLEAKLGSYELSFLVTALVNAFCVCVWCNKHFINFCII